MIKIIADDNIPYLRGRLEDVAEVVYVDQFGFTPEIVKDADALLIRTRTRCNEKLLAGSAVKLVATATIGTDQIDTEWCESNGIMVRNSPGCNAPGVAQYVWSALLRSGFDKNRHKLGIVGCGNVGGIVYDWGRKLGVEIMVSDPPKERLGCTGIPYTPLHRLLRECDAVTLHTPLTKSGDDATFHLIGERELAIMKPGAILVNSARGPVVDFHALKEALRRDSIRAIIDTWEGEPETDSEILDKVIYGTFHIAGYTRQGKQRATRMIIEAVEERFGIKGDTSHLEGVYKAPECISAEEIMNSYDPAEDFEALRKNPAAFDTLRKNYNYREEVTHGN
ncbi:MAG: 4-phosphoerythronate dehydrogenase [Candidatus Amulumruptor caecigallinarius]|nr:4-phosphoerythronate dehydrogenase [Candidatus Amulumruptor caecigallinarius]